MPNWCLNKLEITGSNQEIEQIEKLLNNEQGLLDFNVLTPMPEEIKGPFSTTFEGGMEINTAYEDRLSKLCPDAFMEKLSELYVATKNPAYLVEGMATLFDSSAIFKVNESIEQSITNAVNDYLSTNNSNEQNVTHPRVDDLVASVLKAMQEHNKAQCLEVHGHADWLGWSNANWGTKWNVISDLSNRTHMDGNAVYDFQTAWGPAIQWFNTLIDKIGEMKDNNARVCLKYAEDGMWFGGEVGIGDGGFTYEHHYTDEEICDFLGINEDNIHGDEEIATESGETPTPTELPW